MSAAVFVVNLPYATYPACVSHAADARTHEGARLDIIRNESLAKGSIHARCSKCALGDKVGVK